MLFKNASWCSGKQVKFIQNADKQRVLILLINVNIFVQNAKKLGSLIYF